MLERIEPAPSALGKYRILAELGQGGMARVFLAVVHGPSGFSKLVVVKTIRVHLSEEIDAITMFLDEARVAGRLNHPNVVQTYEIAEYDGRHALVMEYLEGQSLAVILRRAREEKTGLTVPMCLRVISEALNGLHYVHELKDFDGTAMNLVHRDVSPQNIFVTYDGQVKVLDFGIAKAGTSPTETKAGIIKGKVPYMAAEQFLGEGIDRRVDIFAVGAVLWQVATGHRLWKGDADGKVVNRVIQGDIPKPSSVNPLVHPELERVCMRAMSRDRDERYGTSLELQRDIDQVIEQMNSSVTARDVGVNVASAFADVRRQLTDVIERQLSKASSVPSGAGPEFLSVPRLRGVGAMVTHSSAGSYTPDGLSITPVSGSNGRPPWGEKLKTGSSSKALPEPSTVATGVGVVGRKRSRRLVVAGVALTLVVAGVALLVASARNAETITPAAASSSPVTSSATAIQGDSATPVGSTDATTTGQVVLSISAAPASARLFFDDVELATNPFSKRLPSDGAPHRVRAEAVGFESRTIEVRADRDQPIAIVLDRVPHPGELLPPKKSSGDPVSKTPPPPTTTEPVKPTPSASSARDRIKTIDKSNPWN
jgi:serine/threonine-protein kinase